MVKATNDLIKDSVVDYGSLIIKSSSPAMTTVAYTIRKSVIQDCLKVKELKVLTEYIGVYVLKNSSTGTLYVGQVDRRDKGFIGRMIEHQKYDVGEKDWDIAFVFIVETKNGDGLVNNTSLNALESELRWYVNSLANCRTKVTRDYAELNDTGQKVLEDIKLYLKKLIPEYFNLSKAETEQIETIKDKKFDLRVRDLRDTYGLRLSLIHSTR